MIYLYQAELLKVYTLYTPISRPISYFMVDWLDLDVFSSVRGSIFYEITHKVPDSHTVKLYYKQLSNLKS